ncbi:uncharacterized protein LOC123313886 [Coccinella septempunctata]|uniref:uncharacterized protein LOC123313886 n=1 Tax=Coccinella septempunctata TaxID=41139 RepID=UPI001D082C02|nr:uncharacterized protein LOC123313886 [Coccinella septempunctata]
MHKISLATTLLILIVTAHARSVHKGKKNENNKEEYYNSADFDVIYDQKQNGSENYRLGVSGIDVVIAPPASILQAFLSPLSVLALLGEFSRKAPPMLKKNFVAKREGQAELNSIKVTTPTNLGTTDEVVEKQETPSKNLIKNFEEKIQVQELLPGFQNKEETKKDSSEVMEKHVSKVD